MRRMHLLLTHKGRTLLMGLLLALLLQGCITLTCTGCGDKSSEKKCGEAVAVTLTCKDLSIPRDGMCSNGEEAIPSNEVIPQACMQKPMPCGSKCYSWQEGKKGCDTNNPNAKCTTITRSNGACECKCL